MRHNAGHSNSGACKKTLGTLHGKIVICNLKFILPFQKTGSAVSFSQYFKQRYNVEVKDLKQPLLMSNPTKQMKRAGIETPVMLIPE